MELLHNPVLQSAVIAWGVAQVSKIFTNWIATKRFDLTRLFGDGGMPSGHSAAVCALSTSIALRAGLGSVEFALAVLFAVIVMHDAHGVRQETGKQAVALNEIFERLEKLTREPYDQQLEELVGHTRLQVLVGAVLGISVGFIWMQIVP